MTEYAPFHLETDAATLGFVATTVRIGTNVIVARHPPQRGSSTATLLLHGAAGSWTTWTPLLRAAAASGIDLGDTVLFDLPGFGDASGSDGGLEEICTLVALAAEQLGYETWHLVGHSMGGLIAMHLAATRPQHVASVGLVSGTGRSVIESVRHPWAWLFGLPGFVTFRAVMIVLAAIDRPARAIVRFLGRLGILRGFVAPLFRHTRRVDRSVIDALAIEVRPIAFTRAANEVRDYAFGPVTCPVRATKGDVDRFSADSDLEFWRSLGAVTTVIPDCGHFGNVERPFEVLAALYPRA